MLSLTAREYLSEHLLIHETKIAAKTHGPSIIGTPSWTMLEAPSAPMLCETPAPTHRNYLQRTDSFNMEYGHRLATPRRL